MVISSGILIINKGRGTLEEEYFLPFGIVQCGTLGERLASERPLILYFLHWYCGIVVFVVLLYLTYLGYLTKMLVHECEISLVILLLIKIVGHGVK